MPKHDETVGAKIKVSFKVAEDASLNEVAAQLKRLLEAEGVSLVRVYSIEFTQTWDKGKQTGLDKV